MPKLIDITGLKFGRLTVLKISPKRSKHGQVLWCCRCDCGNKLTTWGMSLKNGKGQSCGCLRLGVQNNLTHGHTIGGPSATYRCWLGMFTRCYNKNGSAYKYYGARGIRVCKRWHIFENFLADMGERPPNLSLDRRNNDGPYSPANCRWATLSQQRRNRRTPKHYRRAAAVVATA
jgi:hypothetical protein